VTALTVSHKIAAPLEVIDAALGLQAQNLTVAIKHLDVVDAGSFEAGNRLLLDSHKTLKDLEAARVALKRPITELGKSIDGVVASVADPLDAAKRSMQGKVANYQRKLQAEADALRRQAEERAAAERAEAELERSRLQAEADAKHAADVADAEAKAKAEAAELEAILGKPVAAEPVKVAPAPVIQAAVVKITETPIAPIASAIQTRKVQKVEFTDRMLVPVAVGGFVLRPIDEAAVKKALIAGAVIPGARLVEAEILAMGRA
jgi:Skp family chaperone for outer membrane proteins